MECSIFISVINIEGGRNLCFNQFDEHCRFPHLDLIIFSNEGSDSIYRLQLERLCIEWENPN